MALLSLPSEMERRVRQLEPIADLPAARQDAVIQAGKLLTFSAGAPIFSAGSRDDFVHYLLDGDATIPGDVSGGHVAARGEPLKQPLDAAGEMRRQTAVAGDHAVVFRIPHVVLRHEVEGSAPATANTSADSDLQILRQGLFARLPEETLEDILRCAERRRVASDETIVEQGRPADSFYLIRRGTAAVTRREEDGAVPLHLADLGPGDGIGEEGLISNRRRNATVTMTSEGELLMLRRAHFENLIRNRLLNSHSLVDGETAVELGATWIDARDPDEFAQAAMSGAINVPLATLRERFPDLDSEKAYIVYSGDAGLSAVTAFLLSARGFAVSYVDDEVQVMPDPLAEYVEPIEISDVPATPSILQLQDQAPMSDHEDNDAEATEPVSEQDYAHTISGQSLANLVREIHSDASEVRDERAPDQQVAKLEATSTLQLDEELFEIDVAADEPDNDTPASTTNFAATLDDARSAETAPGGTIEHAISQLREVIGEQVEQARREERGRINTEVKRQTELIRQRAETLMRQKLRDMRAADRERMQAFESRLRSQYDRLTGLANRITHQKAEIQRARREIEEKLRAVSTAHRELSELGLNMTRELDGLDELMPSQAELKELSTGN